MEKRRGGILSRCYRETQKSPVMVISNQRGMIHFLYSKFRRSIKTRKVFLKWKGKVKSSKSLDLTEIDDSVLRVKDKWIKKLSNQLETRYLRNGIKTFKWKSSSALLELELWPSFAICE